MAFATTPRFWDRRGPLSDALLPLSHAYSAATRVFEAAQPLARRAPVPVLCVGAAVVGGTGKTPVALALCESIARRHPSSRVHFLTRGYGGRERGPLRVDPSTHSAARVSDEALLLARAAPTWVSASRWAGASAACASESPPTLLLMDDGLQHPSLHRDLSFLVVDSEYLLGNGSSARSEVYCSSRGTILEPRMRSASHSLLRSSKGSSRNNRSSSSGGGSNNNHNNSRSSRF